MGIRALGLALALSAAAMLLSATTGRDGSVSTRPAPVPTSHYDGRPPPAPDRRPVEQNPTCWITNAGWPRCYERTDTR